MDFILFLSLSIVCVCVCVCVCERERETAQRRIARVAETGTQTDRQLRFPPGSACVAESAFFVVAVLPHGWP